MGTRVKVSKAWRHLADGEDVNDALEVAGMLATSPKTHLGSAVGSVVERTLGILLLKPAAKIEDQMLALLRAGASRAVTDPKKFSRDGQGLIAGSTLLACLPGGSPIDGPDVLARTWAPRAAKGTDEMNDDERNDWALICAAHGLDDLVEIFLTAPPPVEKPVALAQQILAAAEAGKRADTLRPAWKKFVADFPKAYFDDNSLQLSSLLHAGWAVEVRLGGGTPPRVLAAIDAATGLELQR